MPTLYLASVLQVALESIIIAVSMLKHKLSPKLPGFTLVELAAVIAVVGILATISYVGYSGIQDRARKGVVLSDLKAASELLGADFIRSGSTAYPATLEDADRSNGIPASVDTTYQYVVNNSADPPTFCLTGTNGTISFYITQDSEAKEGGCAGHGTGGVAAITNVANNPSAEVAGGWSSNNGSVYPAARVSSIKRSGSQAVEAHHTSSSVVMMSLYAAGADNGYGFPIEEDTTYHVSYYFRSGVPHQGRVGCSFRQADGSYTGLDAGLYISGITNQWTRASHVCTSPPGSTMLRLLVQVNALTTQPPGTSAYADDLMVVSGDAEHAYADGSSPNWIWNGAVGGSTSTGPGSRP